MRALDAGFPFPGHLFEEIVVLLYREDRFMTGTLRVGTRPATPRGLVMPIVGVIDLRSSIVPPSSVLPFFARVSTSDKKVLWYRGDKGVALQHVGALVGQSAHRQLWPEIAAWLHRIARAGGIP
jgi:polyhydroxyalkanoate synthase subunit PhaC